MLPPACRSTSPTDAPKTCSTASSGTPSKAPKLPTRSGPSIAKKTTIDASPNTGGPSLATMMLSTRVLPASSLQPLSSLVAALPRCALAFTSNC